MAYDLAIGDVGIYVILPSRPTGMRSQGSRHETSSTLSPPRRATASPCQRREGLSSYSNLDPHRARVAPLVALASRRRTT
jgi:hypothetical protein